MTTNDLTLDELLAAIRGTAPPPPAVRVAPGLAEHLAGLVREHHLRAGVGYLGPTVPLTAYGVPVVTDPTLSANTWRLRPPVARGRHRAPPGWRSLLDRARRRDTTPGRSAWSIPSLSSSP